MARGGRGGPRKGSGRKPTGRRRVAMLIRVSPEVRSRYEREARSTGRTLSAVAEGYLNYALKMAVPADKQTRGLCYLIERMAILARGLGFSSTADADAAIDGDVTEVADIVTHNFSWRTNRFDFESFKLAVTQLLDRWAPAGTITTSPYSGYETPEEVARTLVMLATIPEVALLPHAESEKKPPGSLYYGQEQAMRDLGLTHGENK